MSELPSGTVTFLFTDIEGSTRLERQLRECYGNVLGRAPGDRARGLRGAWRSRDRYAGRLVLLRLPAREGCRRRRRRRAAGASRTRWPEDGEIRVRMGISTGEASLEGGRYVGFAVHRAARISAAGHGGQILLSSSTRDVVEADLGQGLTVRDLGERRFKDLPRPERVYQLVAEGLPSQFAPLKTLDVEVRRKRRRLYAGAVLIGLLVAAIAIPVLALDEGAEGGPTVEPEFRCDHRRQVERRGGLGTGWHPARRSGNRGRLGLGGEHRRQDGLSHRHHYATARAHDRRFGVPQRHRRDARLGLGCPGRCPAGAADSSRPERGRRGLSRHSVPSWVSRSSSVAVDQAWLAAGGGALWFVCSGASARRRLAHRPAKTTRIDDALVSSSPAAVTFTDVAFGLGSAWIADSGANAVRQIAAEASTTSATSRSAGGLLPSQSVSRSLWVANRDDDSVTRLIVGELTRPDTLATIPVGDAPVDVAVDGDAVWVVNRGDRTISRIDPKAGTVVATIELEHEPVRIAAGDGLVWVTVQEPPEATN